MPTRATPDSCLPDSFTLISIASRSSPGRRFGVAFARTGAFFFAAASNNSAPATRAFRRARFASLGPACERASSTPFNPTISTVSSIAFLFRSRDCQTRQLHHGIQFQHVANCLNGIASVEGLELHLRLDTGVVIHRNDDR